MDSSSGLSRLLYLLFVCFIFPHYSHANGIVGHVPLRRHRTRHPVRLANEMSRGMVTSAVLGFGTHSYLRGVTVGVFAYLWVVSGSGGVEAEPVVVGVVCSAWFDGAA